MDAETLHYMRLFGPDGAWIPRPDYMILSVMSVPDLTTAGQKTPDLISIEHLYKTMLAEDELNPAATDGHLSTYAANAKNDFIKRFMTERVYAGQVVVELVRIAEATGEPPSVNAARRLVAYNHHEHFRTGAPDGARRAVEKAFRRFQSSAHLQAVMILKRSLLKELEGSEEKCREFLGTARAVESFVDNNVVSDSFKWNPLRVPETIEKVSKIDFPRLSDRELKAAGVT